MKTRLFFTFFLLCSSFFNSYSQTDSTLTTGDTLVKTTGDSIVAIPPKPKNHEVYKLNPAVDIPIIAIGTGWSVFAFTKIYSKDPSTMEQILNLDENDIPKFDRWAAGMSDQAADDNSDILFYGSMGAPFLLMFDKEMRKDAGKIAFMYWEAMAITGLLYTGAVYSVDRYRPETYNTSVPVEERMGGNFKDAFFGGHPALVSTAMFFTAKVYADYHPESSFRHVLYVAAIGATGITVYLRHIAGKHFPSDLLIGTSVGTLTGILVPQFHKNKDNKDKKLGFLPYTNGKVTGFYMSYKLK